MAAAAAQQAAKKQTPQSGNTQKNTETKNKKNALHDLPRAAGIAIMALLLAAALFAGNFRALQNASPKDFIRWGDVRSIVEDRIDAAENIVSVASRVGLDANAVNAAESARFALTMALASSASRYFEILGCVTVVESYSENSLVSDITGVQVLRFLVERPDTPPLGSSIESKT